MTGVPWVPPAHINRYLLPVTIPEDGEDGPCHQVTCILESDEVGSATAAAQRFVHRKRSDLKLGGKVWCWGETLLMCKSTWLLLKKEGDSTAYCPSLESPGCPKTWGSVTG